MKKSILVYPAGVLTGAFLLFGVAAADHHDEAMGDPDKHFMQEAAKGGMAEVTLGTMAMQKAESQDVKKFGERMVKDHGKANDELKTLAASEGVTLPKEMEGQAKQLQDRLSKLSGAEFDRTYMEEMVKDHRKDVNAFQMEAEQGKDTDVKSWAAKTLPTLRDHLELAETTAQKVGAETETSMEKSTMGDSSDMEKSSTTSKKSTTMTSEESSDAAR